MYNNLINFIVLCGLSAIIYSQVDYNADIQPILYANCTQCHGTSGGLNLGSYDNLMVGGNSSDVIDPYNHAGSVLWQRINSGEMPPGSNELFADEINLIAQWIDEGAFEEPGSSIGCIDPEAYNCADDVWNDGKPIYIVDIGGVMYDNSANYDWNTSTNQAYYVGGCEYHPDDLPDDFERPNDASLRP